MLNNENLKDLAKEVKQAYNFEEILDQFNINYRKSGNELRTSANEIPFLDNGKNKTRVIFNNKSKTMWDTATDPKKDSLDLISVYAKLNNISDGRAIRELAQKKGLSVMREEPETLNELELDICKYNSTLFNSELKEVREYLHSRGYTDDYLKSHKIGFRKGDKRIVYPYFVNGEIVYFIARKLPEEVFAKVYPNLDYNDIYFEEPRPILDSNGQPKLNSKGEVITYTNDGKYKKASISWNKQKYNLENFYNYAPYNYDSARTTDKVIYLCEGIPDSDTLTIAKKPNICIASTHGTREKGWNELIIPKLKNCKKVVILGDNDRNITNDKLSGGIPSTVDWAKDYLIPNKIFNFEYEIIPRTLQEVNLNDPYQSHFKALTMTDKEFDEKYPEDIRLKDINEYYIKNGYSLNGLKRTRINGFAYLARYYKTIYPETYLENFIEEIIKPTARHLTKPKAKMILNSIADFTDFSEDDLNILNIVLNEAPEESEIVNEIISENELIYNDNTGYYLFDGKTWGEKTDRNINTLIKKALGDRFIRGNKLKPINELIKCDDRVISDNIEFNKKDIVVFNNGTLYLGNTKEETHFEEDHFDPKDRMTFKSDYDYNENAKCPTWEKFINEILEVSNDSEDTEKKVKLIQEFTGYILFSNNDLERILILLGDGANGKTVLFETIEKLFCEDSVSAITTDNFRRQNLHTLKDKILNISGESKSALYGSEEVIKTFATGSKVSDDPKFKDTITFKPRVKLIFCGNNDFTIEDNKSDGSYRRFLFVKFDKKFTDNKTLIERNPERYHKKDIHLKEKLEKELPGIFNWALIGYYRLKQNDEFTEPEEHKTKLSEFMYDNNTILRFLKERDWGLSKFTDNGINYHYFTIGGLFRRFSDYCELIGVSKPTGANNFGKEVTRLLKNEFGTIETKRKRNIHGDFETIYYFTFDPMVIFQEQED